MGVRITQREEGRYGQRLEGDVMLLGAIFDRFAAKSPVSVMVQGSLEFALNASELDSLFERHAIDQYTKTLLFSSAVDLLTSVVCGVHKSVHSVFQACDEPLGVFMAPLYEPRRPSGILCFLACRCSRQRRKCGEARLLILLPTLTGNHALPRPDHHPRRRSPRWFLSASPAGNGRRRRRCLRLRAW